MACPTTHRLAYRMRRPAHCLASVDPPTPLRPQALCISYQGTMYMSIACDDDMPSPEELADLYLDELRLLGLEYGVSSR